jgi:hypothetical protein
MRQTPDVLTHYYVVSLTETFLTEERQLDRFYAGHVLTTQGHLGRLKGGLLCLIKVWLTSFETVHKDENIPVIRTKLATLIMCIFSARVH